MAIVNLHFGHQGGGKLYSYYDPHGTRRAGDEVVIEVTKGKKTYKTLGVIRSTHASGTIGESNTLEHLKNEGIGLKPVLGGSQKQLPGYYKGWAKDAKAAYDIKKEARLGVTSESELSSINKWIDSVRSETRQQYTDSAKNRLGIV